MIKDHRKIYGIEICIIDQYLGYLLQNPSNPSSEDKGNVIRKLVFQRIAEIIKEQEEESKFQLLESAIHALLGLSGENDGYLACAVKHHDGTYGFAGGEMFGSVYDLVEWYKTTFHEEIGGISK